MYKTDHPIHCNNINPLDQKCHGELDIVDKGGDLVASKFCNYNNDMQKVLSIRFLMMTITMFIVLTGQQNVLNYSLGCGNDANDTGYFSVNEDPDVVREE